MVLLNLSKAQLRKVCDSSFNVCDSVRSVLIIPCHSKTLKFFEFVIVNSSMYHKITYVEPKQDYNSIMSKNLKRKKIKLFFYSNIHTIREIRDEVETKQPL